MQKEIFKEIMTNFTNLLEECKKEYSFVVEGKGFDSLQLGEFKRLLEISKTMQLKQDKVFLDFRHIVAMGNLTSSQLSQCCKIFSEYSKFRPYIHWFTYTSGISVADIDLSDRIAKYSLQFLGNYTLYSNGNIEENVNVENSNINKDSLITNLTKLPDDIKKLFVCDKKPGESSLRLIVSKDHFRDFEIVAKKIAGQDTNETPDSDKFFNLGCLEKTPIIAGVAFNTDNSGLFHATIGKNKNPNLYSVFKETYE